MTIASGYEPFATRMYFEPAAASAIAFAIVRTGSSTVPGAASAPEGDTRIAAVRSPSTPSQFVSSNASSGRSGPGLATQVEGAWTAGPGPASFVRPPSPAAPESEQPMKRRLVMQKNAHPGVLRMVAPDLSTPTALGSQVCAYTRIWRRPRASRPRLRANGSHVVPPRLRFAQLARTRGQRLAGSVQFDFQAAFVVINIPDGVGTPRVERPAPSAFFEGNGLSLMHRVIW